MGGIGAPGAPGGIGGIGGIEPICGTGILIAVFSLGFKE
jgi:hypothetical protein